MDQRAVVTLVVVLDDDLPVGRHVVFVPGAADKRLRTIRSDERVQRSDMVGEGWPVACRVDEDPVVPDGDRKLNEAELSTVDVSQPVEARRSDERTAEGVVPRVIGTDERLPAGGGASRQNLVGPMPAGVRQRVNTAIGREGEQ